MAFKVYRLVLASFVLLNIALAGRMSGFAQRKGFGPKLKHKVKALEEARSEDLSNFRFLDDNTRDFRVDNLPDFLFDVGEMYAGLMPIDMNNASRALYFVLQATMGELVGYSALQARLDVS